MGDLYNINLNPDGTAPVTPADGYPDGSIGGSEVGANEQDDQRVRDLIGQEVFVMKQDINNLLVANSSGGSIISWVNLTEVSYVGVWNDFVIGIPVTLLSSGVDQILDLTFGLEVLLTSSALTSILAVITAYLYIDGNLFNIYDIYREPEVTGQIISDRDRVIIRQPLQLTPGTHTFQVDYEVAGDDTNMVGYCGS